MGGQWCVNVGGARWCRTLGPPAGREAETGYALICNFHNQSDSSTRTHVGVVGLTARQISSGFEAFDNNRTCSNSRSDLSGHLDTSRGRELPTSHGYAVT